MIRIVMKATIYEGKADEAKKLLNSAIEISKEKDADLLSYEFFINDAEDMLYSIEWFRDSTALMAHLANVGEILQKLAGATEMQRLEVFGEASREVVEALKPYNPTLAKHWNGFTR